MSTGVWGGLGSAPTFERGTFFNPGSIHDVQIGRCLLKQSQSSGLGLIVETDILTSQASGEINGQTHAPWIPLPNGTAGTWWQGMTDRNVALPAVKGFVYAILGLEPTDPRRGALEQIVPGSERWQLADERGRIYMAGQPMALIEAAMIWACSEANLFQGLIVHLDTKHTTTKKGGPFTIHNWSPINFAAMGLAPPNVDGILNQCRNQPPIPNAPANQGWGSPPAGPPPGYGQPPGPGQWGQPQFQPPQAPPAGPPAWNPQGQRPGYGPPQGPPPGVWTPPPNQAPPAWGPPQGPPPGQPPAWNQGQGQPPQGWAPPNQGQPPAGYGQPQAPPAWGQPPNQNWRTG